MSEKMFRDGTRGFDTNAFNQFHSDIREKNSNPIDRESIVENYKSLRQKQQQFLANINMKDEMKRQLFGFPESFYLQNTEAAQQVVVQVHPFLGKLVIDEKQWVRNQENRQKQRKQKKQEQEKHSIAELDIQIQKESQKQFVPQLMKKIGEKEPKKTGPNSQTKGQQFSSIQPIQYKDSSEKVSEQMMIL